jgi:hypothetical protein
MQAMEQSTKIMFSRRRDVGMTEAPKNEKEIIWWRMSLEKRVGYKRLDCFTNY